MGLSVHMRVTVMKLHVVDAYTTGRMLQAHSYMQTHIALGKLASTQLGASEQGMFQLRASPPAAT